MTRRSSIRPLTYLILVAGHAGIAPAQDDGLQAARAFEAALTSAIERAEKSVVSVERVTGVAVAGEPEAAVLSGDFGSGVIIARDAASEERFVLTAAHVVLGERSLTPLTAEDAEARPAQIRVHLPSRHRVSADIVAADPRSDLAVLRLNLVDAGAPLDAAPPLQFGDASAARKGQFVVALGNPYAIARDGSASCSVGIISNISRRPWPPGGDLSDPTEAHVTIHHYGTLLHVDTRLNLGTSGGALVNLDGELIGLTMSLAALEGYEKSVGYAVPIDAEARRVIESLLKGYEVEYGFLGIHPGAADGETLGPYRQVITQASAAIVRRVAPESPADLGGLRAGDIVLAVDGEEVYDDIDLIREIGWLGPDAIARLTVFRPADRAHVELECRLAKWPVYDDSTLVTTARRYPEWRGLTVDYTTARRRYMPTNLLERFPTGVAVQEIEPGSPADRAGLRVGNFISEVDHVGVLSPSEFAEQVQDLEGEVIVTLLDGRQRTIPAIEANENAIDD
jgi:serine protease Do